MPKFSIFDNYEELMLSFSTFHQHLPSLPTTDSFSPTPSFELLQLQTTTLLDHLINSLLHLQHKSEKLSTHLQKSRIKAKKYFTLQKELSSQQDHIKLKNKSLTSSIKKLKKFMKREVQGLEHSLKKQRKTHSKLSVEYNLDLQEIEKEFSEVFEAKLRGNNEVLDSSAEFEQVMQDFVVDRDEYSRISMEKNCGGWVSDLESSTGSRCEGEEVRNAVGVLLRAGLVKEGNSLYRLSRFLEDNPESENIELILQLIDVRKKGVAESFKDTTPMNSIVMSESGAMQTIVSPGHRVSMFFECEEQE